MTTTLDGDISRHTLILTLGRKRARAVRGGAAPRLPPMRAAAPLAGPPTGCSTLATVRCRACRAAGPARVASSPQSTRWSCPAASSAPAGAITPRRLCCRVVHCGDAEQAGAHAERAHAGLHPGLDGAPRAPAAQRVASAAAVVWFQSSLSRSQQGRLRAAADCWLEPLLSVLAWGRRTRTWCTYATPCPTWPGWTQTWQSQVRGASPGAGAAFAACGRLLVRLPGPAWAQEPASSHHDAQRAAPLSVGGQGHIGTEPACTRVLCHSRGMG